MSEFEYPIIDYLTDEQLNYLPSDMQKIYRFVSKEQNFLQYTQDPHPVVRRGAGFFYR